MLCYVCYSVLSYVIQIPRAYAELCYVMLCNVMLCNAISYHVV